LESKGRSNAFVGKVTTSCVRIICVWFVFPDEIKVLDFCIFHGVSLRENAEDPQEWFQHLKKTALLDETSSRKDHVIQLLHQQNPFEENYNSQIHPVLGGGCQIQRSLHSIESTLTNDLNR
jgi:hypothetical protein